MNMGEKLMKKEKEVKKVTKTNEKEDKKSVRVYHVSKREEDDKWQVKGRGDNKAIKLFNTKAEAEEYTKKMAENQGGTMLTHASKGKNKGKIQGSKVFSSKK